MKTNTALKLVEWTSFPLLLFTGLMVVSGYALTSTSAQRASLFLDFARASFVHLGRLFKLSLLLLLLAHSYAGTELFIARRIRDERLKAFIEYSTIAFLVYVAWVAINGEIG
ncbi:MAG: hypothetical protein J7K57_08020 [Palaeococcus sp.]|uniref:hypothetical protein n=1 Tax=Palaeococcus sp. (in: euryarchaeotes) TaxID=2820298 RepID=UPI0025F124F1|nr:hypothetical protein [Palaeococcus sp. (in: euryarchaeotes)]MCD6559793.1 hypothetical protein [Palaeococcus sp. (in: euryarchaeotes)]